MSKIYLAAVNGDDPVFIDADNERTAFSMLAGDRHGYNNVFQLATKSMENISQLVGLYQTFYHEDVDLFVEADSDKIVYGPDIDWIGDE